MKYQKSIIFLPFYLPYLQKYKNHDGAQSGSRTRTSFGQGILSPSRLPVPPSAQKKMYLEARMGVAPI